MKNPKGASHWRSWLTVVPAIGVAVLPRFT